MSFEPLDIDDAFEIYMRAAYPGLPEHSQQHRECRRVWYAGMWLLFNHMLAVSTTLPEADAARELNQIQKQMETFGFERVREDKD